MTANEIIANFYHRAYFDGHVVFHESDHLYKPDIATISRDLRVNEYEIKVSLQDLRKELDYIDFVISDHDQNIPATIQLFDFQQNGQNDVDAWDQYQKEKNKRRESEPKRMTRDDNKYRKHRHYLFDERGDWAEMNRPNRFYFLIPKELYEAEKTRIDAIPKYGVIQAETFYSLKRCYPIHNETANAQLIWQAALNVTGRLRNEIINNGGKNG